MLCYQKIEPVDFNECTRIMTAAFDRDTALHTDCCTTVPGDTTTAR